ncbi:hypothetical protein BOX15_Mlig019226g1 [Macrostomum lignano]|uniref:Cadherin domain-containing protein n=1 Tax=Macrostomum lignano TaxID=282301 RepID=A0A267GXW0_9PLAT|nr:hypothetical protein BOX15_Mlig019226g1 [Macrostomum lignano]
MSNSREQRVPKLVDVIIQVDDQNNSPPNFGPYQEVEVQESAEHGAKLSLPKAEDADKRGFASCHLSYRLESCTPGKPADPTFALELQNNSNGGPRDVYLKLLDGLDREKIEQYAYCLIASDGRHTASLTVSVRVIDVNDNAPKWSPNQKFNVSVSETNPPNPLLRLNATDADSKYGQVHYTLVSDKNNLFSLTRRGSLTLKNPRELDYDQQIKEHRVVVAAVDNGKPPKSATATVTIIVLDENDNPPQIKIRNHHVSITENNKVPLHILNIIASDLDTGAGGIVTCSLQPDGFNPPRFLLTSSSAPSSPVSYELNATYSLDREERSRYVVGIQCYDGGTPQKTSTQKVYIAVLDQNDNAPKFEVTPIDFSISEDTKESSRVYNFRIHDPDYDGQNRANRRFEIRGDGASKFQVDYDRNNSYSLTTTDKFDRETKDTFSFSLVVQDIDATHDGAVIHQAETNVSIRILDANDCYPRFLINLSDPQAVAGCSSQGLPEWLPPVTVLENATIGSIVTKVAAIDGDLGLNGTVTYRLRGSPTFRVDGSGQVLLNRQLDADMPHGQSSFTLELLAVDSGTVRRLTGTASLIVRLADVNDNFPEFVHTQPLRLNVSCDRALTGNCLTTADDVAANDADAVAEHRQMGYRLVDRGSSSQLHTFQIDSNSGDVCLNSTPKLCTAGVYRFQLEVFDKDRPRGRVSRKLVIVTFEGGGRRPGSSVAANDNRWLSGHGNDPTLSAGGGAADGENFNGSERDAKPAVLASVLIVFLVALVGLTTLVVIILLRWCAGHRHKSAPNDNRSRTQGTSVVSSSTQQNQQRQLQQSIGCLSPMDVSASSSERVLLDKQYAMVAMPGAGGGGSHRYDSLGRQQPHRHPQRHRNASLNNGDDLSSVEDDPDAAAAAAVAAANASRTMPTKVISSSSSRNYRSQQQLLLHYQGQQHQRAAYQELTQPLPPHHSGSEGYMACQQFQFQVPSCVSRPRINADGASSSGQSMMNAAEPLAQSRSCSRMIDSKRPSQPSSLKSSYLTISHV